MSTNEMTLPESTDKLKNWLHIILTVEIVGVVLSLFVGLLEDAIFEVAKQGTERTNAEMTTKELIEIITGLFIFFVAIPSLIASWIALFKSKWWGKWLYVTTWIAINIVILPYALIDFELGWGFSEWFTDLLNLNTGLILGLLFFTKLSNEFRMKDSNSPQGNPRPSENHGPAVDIARYPSQSTGGGDTLPTTL